MGVSEQDAALLCWVGLFINAAPTDFESLSDGLVLADIFSRMHPKHQIPERVLVRKENWVLTKGNLDEVVSRLNKVYKRFGTGLDVTELVNTDAIAEEKCVSEIKNLLELLLTSMFASTRTEELGTMIMPLQGSEETADVPECLMSIMQDVQQRHNLDPTDLVEDDEDTFESTDGPVPAASSSPHPSPTHADPAHLLSHSKTAADYEEMISSLEDKLRDQAQDLSALEQGLAMQRDEKAIVEQKYQQLYDKQFSQLPSPEPAEASLSNSASVDKLAAELMAKDQVIVDLQKRIQDFMSKETEWVQTADELQIAQHDLAEAKREAEKVAHIREQREQVTKERNHYKMSMEAAESKLDEEMARALRLTGQLDRADGKLKRAEEVNAEKVVMDVKLQDALRRLEEAENELQPVKEELVAAQRSIRQMKADTASLKLELESAQQAQPASSSLADELGGGASARDRDELLSIKREICTLREDLRERDEECEKLQASQDKSKAKTMELLEQVADYKSRLEEAEEQAKGASSIPSDFQARLDSLKEEVKVKDQVHDELEKEVQQLKGDLVDAKSDFKQKSAELEKLRKQQAAPSSFPRDVQKLSEQSQNMRASLDARGSQKARVEDKMAEAIAKQQKEMKRVSASFFSLGKASISQQIGLLGASHEPQSWLAKRKHQAHSFNPSKHS
eukprot:TRINITY_DN34772_c0_g1_i1.p1 TRINITY_DN34772_c0_g1~~TRINITY_DN34772_c0_g1_i1.p1  ORF type:complete len:680 (+),score=334.09 TRINITY_DN34772_c0_g1_i1:81-2120(+)